jgi:hypothetical protein
VEGDIGSVDTPSQGQDSPHPPHWVAQRPQPGLEKRLSRAPNPPGTRMIAPQALSTRRLTRQAMRFPLRKHGAELLRLWATSGSTTAGQLFAVDSILRSISPQRRTLRRELTQECRRVEEWRGGLGRPCVWLALSVASA